MATPRRGGRASLSGGLVIVATGLLASALVLVGSGTPARAVSRSGSPEVVLWLGGAAAGAAMPAGFLGLSLETYGVQTYTGSDPHATNPVFTALVRAMSPRGRLVFRIGGDSADQSWWPVRGMARPPSVSYDLSSRWAASLRRLAAATNARLILDLNLGSGSPRLAAGEARSMVRAVGRTRIAAFEIGNEPERYAAERLRPRGYDISAYVREFERWRAGVPAMPLAGPATGAVSWLRRTGGLMSRLRAVTFHFYPLNKCVTDPRSRSYPSVSNLLSVNSSRGPLAGIAPSVATAHRHGLAFRVDELNAVTCGGRAGVSDTFASALWMVDTLFELRRLEADAVNVHIWPGAPANQLFTFSRRQAGWIAHVRPAYYGLLFFSQAAPAGSRLLRIRAASRSRALRSWATVAPDGTRRVVLINDSLTTATTVLVPTRSGASPAILTRLLAPRASATSGVTLAGRSFGGATTTGVLPGPPRVTIVAAGPRGYRVTVPPAGAAMLVLAPS